MAFVYSVAILVPKQDSDEIKRETWSCQSETQQRNLNAARNWADSFDQTVTSSDKRAEIIANEIIKQDFQREEQQRQKLKLTPLKPTVDDAKSYYRVQIFLFLIFAAKAQKNNFRRVSF